MARPDYPGEMLSDRPLLPLVSYPFKPRTNGGRAQRFCRALCRRTFYAACRTWAVQGVLDGALGLEAIRKASPATCTLVTAQRYPPGHRGAANKVIASLTLPQRLAGHTVHFWSRPTSHTTSQRGEMWRLRCCSGPKKESRCCSGPVRVLHRCCSGTKPSPSVHRSTRQDHFATIHRCCTGTPI
jgi:hypothetical protein